MCKRNLLQALFCCAILLAPSVLSGCGESQSVPNSAAVEQTTQNSIDIPTVEAPDVNSDTTETVLSSNTTNTSSISSISSNETYIDEKEEETVMPELVSLSDDRSTYEEGFFYQSITADVKLRINGLSYKADCTVPYEDLRYVGILYYDFNEEVKQGEIICNKRIAQDLVEIFYELYENKYQIDKIRLIDEYNADDDLSCADNNTSCFNFRQVYGSSSLSKHALGLAIDINPFQNPYVTYPDGVERISLPGSEPYADRKSGLPHIITEDDLCYQLFTQHGFQWGGHWNSLKDYQHFQKVL